MAWQANHGGMEILQGEGGFFSLAAVSETMKIAAVTKFKHGELYLLMKKLGWTNAELCNRTGISRSTLSHILNLQTRPKPETAEKIHDAFVEAGEYLDIVKEWPELFRFKGVVEQVEDIDPERLLDFTQPTMIDAYDPISENELKNVLNKSLATLHPKKRLVLERRFQDDAQYTEIGKELGVTRERVKQLEDAGLMDLRKELWREDSPLKELSPA